MIEMGIKSNILVDLPVQANSCRAAVAKRRATAAFPCADAAQISSMRVLTVFSMPSAASLIRPASM